jgi:hypothetical protein
MTDFKINLVRLSVDQPLYMNVAQKVLLLFEFPQPGIGLLWMFVFHQSGKLFVSQFSIVCAAHDKGQAIGLDRFQVELLIQVVISA